MRPCPSGYTAGAPHPRLLYLHDRTASQAGRFHNKVEDIVADTDMIRYNDMDNPHDFNFCVRLELDR